MKRALLVCMLVALLVAGPAAAGLIVVGKSVRGVRLGMTQKQVRAVLGAPRTTVHKSNEFGPYTDFRYATLKITFQGNETATAVSTTAAADRTAGGVGVGSTRAAVRAKVAGLKCEGAVCSVGKFVAGARVTSFFFGTTGRVKTVQVGFVID